MSFSIREYLTENGVALRDSVYEASDPAMLDFQIYSGDFYKLTEKNGKKALRYKNAVDLMGFEMLTGCLPALDRIRLADRRLFPYGVENLDRFADALAGDRARAAVEGGPCLFSAREVIAEVSERTGRTLYFDYSEGKAYPGAGADPLPEEDQEIEGFASYVRFHMGTISDIRFHSHKTGLTPQEYLHLRMPFEVAAALDLPLVLTLPDMSYRKYLAYALEEADETFRARVMEAFDGILYSTVDKYLELIDRLQQAFRVRDLKIVHGRDRDLLEKFYAERAPFIERRSILKNLTGIPEKMEPVKDYISMPALPYYLDRADWILEVNSVVEADSLRKCMKAHRGAAQFACIMFPELRSADGIHTMYYAPPEYKEYGSYPLDFHETGEGENSEQEC